VGTVVVLRVLPLEERPAIKGRSFGPEVLGGLVSGISEEEERRRSADPVVRRADSETRVVFLTIGFITRECVGPKP
jgi:hypothetical protein